MSPKALATLYMVNLDCADPRAMAGFYSALLGWEMERPAKLRELGLA